MDTQARKGAAKSVMRGRKRGRHPAACADCHRRKQKCDGSEPCFNCSRRGVASTCSYGHLSHSLPSATRPALAPSRLGRLPRGESVENRDGSERLAARSRSGNVESRSQSTGTAAGSGVDGTDRTEQPVGSLFKSRDAPSFFGSSYFGPQAAAKVIQAPAPELSVGIYGKAEASSAHSFRDEGGPFSQIWDLLGLLPRKRSTVDRLTECFLQELNWAIDAVHPASFRANYESFWSRKFGFDDLATVDLRWLALLFIVLAYGVLLDCPKPQNQEIQREVHDTSLRFYWAARRAIVIAPTFYGESTDLVRAGVLVTRYLIYSRRVPESWLTTSFAMRMAQAQGIHIDGERWRLSRKETETRRRLWSHLYVLDKTIALALGRPFAIVDQQCLVQQATNVWLDDLDDQTAESVPEQPIAEPTLSICNRLAHQLAIIVGKVQEECFGLYPVSYETVLSLDAEISGWESSLPSFFRLENPDRSKDDSLPFLRWNRLHLHSLYHFARVTLHRPFLLRQSITNRYQHSHDVCIASACADLDMRLKYFSQPLTDRLKWTLGPHHLFNSALVLGIIAVRDPSSRRSQAILEDLTAYCELQRRDSWLNEFALAEVKIVELCIKKAKHPQQPHDSAPLHPARAPQSSNYTAGVHASAAVVEEARPLGVPASAEPSSQLNLAVPPSTALGPASWDDPAFFFPEASDLLQWEQVLDSIMQDQVAE